MAALLLGQIVTQTAYAVTPRVMTEQRVLVYQSGNSVVTATIKRVDEFSLVTPHYTQLFINGNVTKDGMVTTIFSAYTMKFPLQMLLSASKSNSNFRRGNRIAAGPYNITHYDWHDINFLKEPGSAKWHVKYDHPNNVDDTNSSGVYYDAGPNEGTPTVIAGSDGIHCVHLPKWQLDDAKNSLNVWSLLCGLGALGTGIIGLLVTLGILTLGVVPGIILATVVVILAFVAVYSAGLKWFIEDELETELDDGWLYSWGYGSYSAWWFHTAWWWMSFGRLRDIGLFFFGATIQPQYDYCLSVYSSGTLCKRR